MNFAVFGDPIGHSKSPAMHTAAFAALGLPHRYSARRVGQGELAAALREAVAQGMGGLNLTVPLKETAVGLMDALSAEAERVGAVNTVEFDDGRLRGHNTDGIGFLRGLGRTPQRAVVLGGGGASRAVVDALLRAGAAVAWVSRTPQRLPAWGATATAYGALDLSGADLLVNATTVGMRGGPSHFPVPLPLTDLEAGAVVVDIVYPRPPAGLLDRAQAAGCEVMDGRPMLLQQGVAALEIWLRRRLPPSAIAAMAATLQES